MAGWGCKGEVNFVPVRVSAIEIEPTLPSPARTSTLAVLGGEGGVSAGGDCHHRYLGWGGVGEG
jgi:hypothetical protein